MNSEKLIKVKFSSCRSQTNNLKCDFSSRNYARSESTMIFVVVVVSQVVVSNMFYIHPDPMGNDPIWRAYFSAGWFNHQVLKTYHLPGKVTYPLPMVVVPSRSLTNRPWKVTGSRKESSVFQSHHFSGAFAVKLRGCIFFLRGGGG